MSYGELNLPPEYTGINKQTGRFMKGHTPANKGKRWGDYMSRRSQRRSAKGWKNLDKCRPTTRPDTAGRSRKQVVAVMDDGTWELFSYVGEAAEWVGGNRENVGRCCRANQSKRVLSRDWRPGQKRGASRVNTDHRYIGVRFYFESDGVWTKKIIR